MPAKKTKAKRETMTGPFVSAVIFGGPAAQVIAIAVRERRLKNAVVRLLVDEALEARAKKR